MWLGGRGLPNMSEAPDSIPTSTRKGVGVRSSVGKTACHKAWQPELDL